MKFEHLTCLWFFQCVEFLNAKRPEPVNGVGDLNLQKNGETICHLLKGVFKGSNQTKNTYI